jgi:hypothetical protein
MAQIDVDPIVANEEMFYQTASHLHNHTIENYNLIDILYATRKSMNEFGESIRTLKTLLNKIYDNMGSAFSGLGEQELTFTSNELVMIPNLHYLNNCNDPTRFSTMICIVTNQYLICEKNWKIAYDYFRIFITFRSNSKYHVFLANYGKMKIHEILEQLTVDNPDVLIGLKVAELIKNIAHPFIILSIRKYLMMQ